MADLVIPNQSVDDICIPRVLPVWTYYYDEFSLINTDVSGTLSGIYEIGGTLIADAYVSVFYRPTRKLVARAKTDVNGAWSVGSLEKGVASYFAIAETDTARNMLIFDKLVPV